MLKEILKFDIITPVDDNYLSVGDNMRTRKQSRGNKNIVGVKVEAIRKSKDMKQKELLAQLQVKGVDMNTSGLSKLEGQFRSVSDIELKALAEILETPVEYLLGMNEE